MKLVKVSIAVFCIVSFCASTMLFAEGTEHPGLTVFKNKKCTTCHGKNPKKFPDIQANGLSGKVDIEKLAEYLAQTVMSSEGKKHGKKVVVTPDEAAQLKEYMKSIPKKEAGK